MNYEDTELNQSKKGADACKVCLCQSSTACSATHTVCMSMFNLLRPNHNTRISRTSIHSSSIEELDPLVSMSYHLWILYGIVGA